MNDLIETENQHLSEEHAEAMNDYLIFQLDNQAFCINVGLIRDVLRMQKLTHVPLLQESISGVMNLRGHIVTAIDARIALDVPKPENNDDMSVVIEKDDYLYSIIVDRVRDVLTFEENEMEKNPSILEGKLRDISQGVIKHENELVICLDVDKLFNMIKDEQDNA
jgi:purine-binding chemotaxis protein CheW